MRRLTKNKSLDDFVVNQYRYNKIAFILPPWEEIYETDSERKQDFDIAIETYQVMKKTYNDIRYDENIHSVATDVYLSQLLIRIFI